VAPANSRFLTAIAVRNDKVVVNAAEFEIAITKRLKAKS